MNRTIRGMAGLLVALGASACANDWSLDFGGPPTQVQASPDVMFITSGAAPKELLLRLINDRNQSVPAEWTVTNVPSGMTVVKDENYRPDWINPDDELKPDALQVQHRYFVSANIPTGGQFTFTVASQGISKQVTVRVLPSSLGAALSAGAPALGDEVTITAPATMSFNENTSTVTFTPGGAAIITNRTTTSISFLPRPGSEGPATVTNVTLNYAPTLAPRTLTTANTIMVPAVGDITGTFSTTSPAAGGTFTYTATGSFVFLENVAVSFGGRPGAVTNRSADGKTITVMPPIGVTGATMTVSNSILSFLPEIVLAPRPALGGTVTTPGTYSPPVLANTGSGVAGSPTITVGTPAPGGGLYDGGPWTSADALGGGGPNRWYRLTVTGTTRNRPIWVDWAGVIADLDFYMTNAGITAFVGSTSASAGSSQPETQTVSLAAADYWIVPVNWNRFEDPAWIFIVVQ